SNLCHHLCHPFIFVKECEMLLLTNSVCCLVFAEAFSTFLICTLFGQYLPCPENSRDRHAYFYRKISLTFISQLPTHSDQT
uniref:Uncharacterized protein n=2 Tax=Aegilops tauschii subsp. strangulata TaxID=200361 RepID=A0A453S8H3_AEGTS